MWLTAFSWGRLFSRFWPCALHPVRGLVVEANDALWKNNFIDQVCGYLLLMVMRVYIQILSSLVLMWMQNLLLLNKYESLVQADAVHIFELASFRKHHLIVIAWWHDYGLPDIKSTTIYMGSTLATTPSVCKRWPIRFWFVWVTPHCLLGYRDPWRVWLCYGLAGCTSTVCMVH